MKNIFPQNIPAAENPDFGDNSRVHNWRNYIHGIVKTNWYEIDLTARCIIIQIAEDVATDEDWD